MRTCSSLLSTANSTDCHRYKRNIASSVVILPAKLQELINEHLPSYLRLPSPELAQDYHNDFSWIQHRLKYHRFFIQALSTLKDVQGPTPINSLWPLKQRSLYPAGKIIA